MSSVPPADALLIHVTGHDTPGLTAELTRILAAHHVVILDVGHALVQETLSLAILVEPLSGESSPVLKVAD
jgi:phosphoserine phosphatase